MRILTLVMIALTNVFYNDNQNAKINLTITINGRQKADHK